MTWTIGLEGLTSARVKSRSEGQKINDNDHSTFKRKIQCVGSAAGFFFNRGHQQFAGLMCWSFESFSKINLNNTMGSNQKQYIYSLDARLESICQKYIFHQSTQSFSKLDIGFVCAYKTRKKKYAHKFANLEYYINIFK